MKKILVTAPISKVKDYCMEDWINHILNLTYASYDILLVDNSHDNNYYKELKKKFPQVNFLYFNPTGLESKVFITQCQEKSRAYAISNNYTHIMSIECDVFPPLNVIEELLRVQSDIACGFYSFDFEHNRKPLLQSSDYFNTHYSIRNMDYDETFILADGKNHQIFGGGLGCCLISRKVFCAIPFRIVDKQDSHSDPYFFMDCELSGFTTTLNTNMFCEHRNQNWSHQYSMILNQQLFK
jgi:hypothetical protein